MTNTKTAARSTIVWCLMMAKHGGKAVDFRFLFTYTENQTLTPRRVVLADTNTATL